MLMGLHVEESRRESLNNVEREAIGRESIFVPVNFPMMRILHGRSRQGVLCHTARLCSTLHIRLQKTVDLARCRASSFIRHPGCRICVVFMAVVA
jgi:hypothetical protein